MEGLNARLWLDDGSVVIQAELTQFRVHRTVLSRHSQVFRNMFSVPQPVYEDNIEGCPIVHLSDSAQDVSHLLSALYDQVYTTRDPLPFSVLAAMLRLGSKYEINHLREDALFRLRADFPTTLDNWDELCGHKHILEEDGILYDLINLAIEQGLWSILPAAYYFCILDGNDEDIFKGQTREDGSRVVLLPEAQHAYFLGRQKIQEQQATTTLLWLSDDDVSKIHCTRPQQCAKDRCALSISIFKPVADPSRSLEPWADTSKNASLCESCLEDAEIMHEEGRETMWNNMPENFGFPPWDELIKMDR